MNKEIRQLHKGDYSFFEAMDTGIKDDYILRIFERLTTGNHRLYGLFIGNKLISMGGYTVFAGYYAMLGRLRSDRRYRGNNMATKILTHVMNEAFQLNGIQWVGGNTQEDNIPARRVLEKLGLNTYTTLHGAVTQVPIVHESGSKIWSPIHSLERKKRWLREKYVKPEAVFPYEVYYSFPASNALFQEEEIMEWSFYENHDKTRFLITKKDQKKNHYLHVIYPWSDIGVQQGLWETVSKDYLKLLEETEESEEDAYIWIDIKKNEINSLPNEHSFELPTPWVLYGKTK
ncbi:GNAT family N-acetyltransferase [Evansella sp. AB-P1]|uniref:GNAT family N-acetyltransferase n=1 Tax=Evansella sp. AB-P1 TaxID=3037653 RepID=UPI00241DB207|nr:GNAT family N-acetyltransferase [Evansella sp. AB-P1]MDG5787066.1 GNAT family N-acetyltransferase [Evansella sp. AB-P1]